ncbi:MAG: diguanylate cyclase [Spirochaetota bacterium]
MESLPDEIFLAALASVSDAVMITDAQLNEAGPHILYVNSVFEKTTGYQSGEVRGRSISVVLGPDTDPLVLQPARGAVADGEPFQDRITIHRKDETSFIAEWNMVPYSGASGRPMYYILILRELTEKLKALRYTRQLELIQHVRREITSEGLNLDAVRQRVADVSLEITGADAAVVEEPEGEHMVYRAVAGRAKGTLGLRLRIDQSLSGLCYRTEETLICTDSQTDARIRLKEKALEIGFRSALLAPLLHQGRCYGVLKVYSSRQENFSTDEQRLIELSSDILASALFDAVAFDEEVRKRQILLDAVPISIAYIDTDRRYVEVNASHEVLFGLPVSEIRGRPLRSILLQDNYNRLRPYLDGALAGESVNFEVELQMMSGEERTYRGNLEPHFDGRGKVVGCYAAVQDITDEKLAGEDFLTGLPNRRKFEELAGFLMHSRERKGTQVSFLMLDIDKFKHINDNYGHAAGDEVLISLGSILSRSVRRTDVFCRWGGEEFAVLLNESDLERARVFAERLLESIRSCDFGRLGKITASIGIAEAGPDEELKALQKRADQALYRAKAEGRDRAATIW